MTNQCYQCNDSHDSIILNCFKNQGKLEKTAEPNLPLEKTRYENISVPSTLILVYTI